MMKMFFHWGLALASLGLKAENITLCAKKNFHRQRSCRWKFKSKL